MNLNAIGSSFFSYPFARIASAIFILLILSPLFLWCSQLCFVAVLCRFPLFFFSEISFALPQSYILLLFCKETCSKGRHNFLADLVLLCCSLTVPWTFCGIFCPNVCIVLIVVRFVTIMRSLSSAVLHMEVSIQIPVYNPSICCCFKDN